MHIEATNMFIRLYKKLPVEMQERTKKTLALLQDDPSHPSLHHKKMTGSHNLFEVRVSDNYRVTYQKIQNTAYLRKIGTHDVLKQP